MPTTELNDWEKETFSKDCSLQWIGSVWRTNAYWIAVSTVVCCLQKVMYSHSFSAFILIFLLTPNLEDWRMTQAWQIEDSFKMTMNDDEWQLCRYWPHSFYKSCLAQFMFRLFTAVYGLNSISFVSLFLCLSDNIMFPNLKFQMSPNFHARRDA